METELEHLRYEQQFEEVHAVAVAGSAYLPEGEYRVNSVHHQAVQRLGRGLRATAHAPDGTVEMLEHETLPWIGVQGHPECVPGTSFSVGVFEAFLRLVRERA